MKGWAFLAKCPFMTKDGPTGQVLCSLARHRGLAIPPSETMKKLVDYEGSVGEEYMSLVGSRLSAFDEEDATIKKVLLFIARDEERHKEILKQAITAESAD